MFDLPMFVLPLSFIGCPIFLLSLLHIQADGTLLMIAADHRNITAPNPQNFSHPCPLTSLASFLPIAHLDGTISMAV